MQKISLIGFLIISFHLTANAQYLIKSSFYPVNQYMVNPAIMNKDNKTMVYLSGRNHWASLVGSPMDLYLGLNHPFTENVSGGFRLTGDKQGIFNTYLSELTYSYKMKINNNQFIYYGLAMGAETFRLNKNDITTGTLADPVLVEENFNTTEFSAGIGVYYAFRDLFVSASLPQMLKYDKLYETAFGSIGYDFTAIENETEVLAFQPSVSAQVIPVSPVQYDFNLTTRVMNRFHIQTTYISNESFITGLGISYNDVFLGYAYEFSTGDLSHLSKGSHEVMLSYSFKSAGVFFKNLFSGEEAAQKSKEDAEMQNIFNKYRAKEDESYNTFYIVVGAYYELKDAVDFRDVLRDELNIDSEIMEREDGKYFFVYTNQMKNREQARQRAIELNKSDIKKYIRGNVWLYGEKE